MEIGNCEMCLGNYKGTSPEKKKSEDLCREIVGIKAGISIPAVRVITFLSENKRAATAF